MSVAEASFSAPALEARDLDFCYEPGGSPVLREVTLTIEAGARCLLVGRNGAGKTTLLSLFGGRHMIAPDDVRALGRPAFHDTSLAAEVAFLGGDFPFEADISVGDILSRAPLPDAARRDRLLRVLGVDPAWRMHRVSAGQRRRVQLLLGLLPKMRVLLLDEITTDLDLVARQDLLRFLREESEARTVTIIYATHVLDGLDDWATHLLYLRDGRVARFNRLDELAEMRALREGGVTSPLLRLVERWMRDEAGRDAETVW